MEKAWRLYGDGVKSDTFYGDFILFREILY